MSERQDIYIKAIMYGSQRDTFTIQDITEHLDLTKEQEFRLAFQIKNKEIFYHDRSNYLEGYDQGESINLSLSVEDEFRLLEYIELKEARASSKQATWFASAALVVSILTAFLSTYFSYKSLNSEINYPETVKEDIREIKESLHVLRDKAHEINTKPESEKN